MATKKPKTRRKGTRRTSDRVARISGQVLQRIKGLPAKTELTTNDWEQPLAWVTVGEARAMAASLLNQDEHAGRRGK